MLGQFEDMMLNTEMEKLANSLASQNWGDMKFAAHSLKGSSGYIGVSRLHYACYYVQYYFMKSNFEAMVDFYPLVVETAIEFKIYSRIILAQKNGINHFTSYFFLGT